MKFKEEQFFEKVYKVVKHIPKGKVSTYGAIARYIGSPQSARVVGWAMNSCVNRNDVPAHRVVNRLGLLTGKHHFGGTNRMQNLLEEEGHGIIDNQIQNFQSVLWEPAKELPYFEDL